jgi:peptidoglycan hydrolase-like protein with peptidoglycan-binding domain
VRRSADGDPACEADVVNHSRLTRTTTLAAAAAVATVGLFASTGTAVKSSAPITALSPGLDATGVAGATAGSTTAPGPSSTVASPTTTNTTTSTTTPAIKVTAPPTTSATPGVPSLGSSGPAVLQVQQRLASLGYWLGTPDGHFGGTTQQAVWALQKAAGISRTGIIDAATSAALNAGTLPTPTSSSGHVVEVNLSRQLVLIVTNGHLDAVLNTSTGGGYTYFDQGSKQVAITPKGHFTTTWEVNGTRVSSLGVLWRPKYFVGGIAIHGDGYVPPRPVSHGCVRVSNAAIDWIWASGADPIGTSVWVY